MAGNHQHAGDGNVCICIFPIINYIIWVLLLIFRIKKSHMQHSIKERSMFLSFIFVSINIHRVYLFFLPNLFLFFFNNLIL